MSRYNPPELLAARHQLAGFRCRSEEQTAWLVEFARQAHGTCTTRVFVVTQNDQPAVVAYYAWCMASVGIQPVALLARLGVHESHESQGLGTALLLYVISRVASLSDAIGCRGLLVHAESEQARGFYEHLIPELERSPTDPLHLLLLKVIRHTLGSGTRTQLSGVGCKPGGQLVRAAEIKQRLCQGLKLLQRQRLDAGSGGFAQGAAAEVEEAEGHLGFSAGFSSRFSEGFSSRFSQAKDFLVSPALA